MKALLEGLLPRVLPGVEFLCIPHEGKRDLQRSIPRKLRAWREPGVRFVVVQDNDGSDCRVLKGRLRDLCIQGGRSDSLIRIPCQELEAWYLGDLEILAEAFSDRSLPALGKTAKFRDPDAVQFPARELRALVPEFQKISGARLLGGRLRPEANRSRSFQVFLSGVRRLAGAPEG